MDKSVLYELESIQYSGEDKHFHDQTQNKLVIAKELLLRIQEIEKAYLAPTPVSSKTSSISPISMPKEKIDELSQLKDEFKLMVIEMLKKRAEFTGILGDDDTGNHEQEIVEEDSYDLVEFVKTTNDDKPPKFNFFIELAKPYYKLFLVLIIVCLIAFGILGAIAGSYDYADYIGPWIVISRASAWAIFTATGILMFFVSYEILTALRLKWKGRCLIWFNNNIIIHRFWGYVMTFFGTLHTIGHCLGSIKKISEEDDISKANAVTLHHDFNGEKSYTDLLFFSIPGSTGIILTILMFLMAITSMKWFRRNFFQAFAYIHVVSYPLFLILLIIHGCGTWFNWGFPLGAIFVTPAIVAVIIQQYIKMKTVWKFKFKIADVSISDNKKYIMIYFIKPQGFTLRHGQYVFVNIPEVNSLQWHPFTVASCPESKFLLLMIKRAGDWTGKLIDILYEQK